MRRLASGGQCPKESKDKVRDWSQDPGNPTRRRGMTVRKADIKEIIEHETRASEADFERHRARVDV